MQSPSAMQDWSKFDAEMMQEGVMSCIGPPESTSKVIEEEALVLGAAAVPVVPVAVDAGCVDPPSELRGAASEPPQAEAATARARTRRECIAIVWPAHASSAVPADSRAARCVASTQTDPHPPLGPTGEPPLR